MAPAVGPGNGKFAVGLGTSVLVTVEGVTEQPCNSAVATMLAAKKRDLIRIFMLTTHCGQFLQHLVRGRDRLTVDFVRPLRLNHVDELFHHIDV